MATCSNKDNDPDPNNCYTEWSTVYLSQTEAYVNALQAYNEVSSPANCAALKQAAQGWVNALKPFQNCNLLTGVEREDFLQALQEFEDDIPNLCEE